MEETDKERPRHVNRDSCSTAARLRQRQTEEKTGRKKKIREGGEREREWDNKPTFDKDPI